MTTLTDVFFLGSDIIVGNARRLTGVNGWIRNLRVYDVSKITKSTYDRWVRLAHCSNVKITIIRSEEIGCFWFYMTWVRH